jgi:hypothetical protein
LKPRNKYVFCKAIFAFWHGFLIVTAVQKTRGTRMLQRIAVVGAGISGLMPRLLISRRSCLDAHVTLFEPGKNRGATSPPQLHFEGAFYSSRAPTHTSIAPGCLTTMVERAIGLKDKLAL